MSEITAFMDKEKKEEKEAVKEQLYNMTVQLNDTKRKLAGFDDRYMELQNTNKALKLKLEVKQELQLLTQKTSGQDITGFAQQASDSTTSEVVKTADLKTVDGAQSWNETAKALSENQTVADQNKKLLNPTAFDESGNQVGFNNADSKPDDSEQGQTGDDNILDMADDYEKASESHKEHVKNSKKSSKSKNKAPKTTKKQAFSKSKKSASKGKKEGVKKSKGKNGHYADEFN